MQTKTKKLVNKKHPQRSKDKSRRVIEKKKKGKYIRRVRGARRYRTLQVMADSRTAAVVAAAAAANCINITVITGTTNGT